MIHQMDRPLNPASAARLLFFECSAADIEWWTKILTTLAETREVEPVKLQAFMNTLAEVIPGIENTHIGNVIGLRLSLSEKCFLAAALDSFMDVRIGTAGLTLGEWTKAWTGVSDILIPAGKLIRSDPSYIDAAGMNRVWDELRAAAS